AYLAEFATARRSLLRSLLDLRLFQAAYGIEQLGGRYRAQLTGYATALERAWSLAKPPRAELLLLRAARALRVT
ncbi:MAG: hypothetical protein CMJ85_13530, partial [Planctomycetes bacterium]|nr:hypothetical protein [Planctomycetota bacterium]